MAAAGVLLVLLLSLSSSGSHIGGGLWEAPRMLWGMRVALAEDSSAFLASRLPLKPLITTPVELMSSLRSPVSVSGRQAITVVFSRPVIALGGDFGTTELWAGKVPYNLTCATSEVPAGKARWVTTTIARFDPDDDWPTDLDCSFLFNQHLAAYDGARMQLVRPGATRRLVTQPLSFFVSGVLSQLAANATGGSWTPTISARPGSDDNVPEVPPDGVVTLYLNYPVNRTLLAGSLQLQPNPDNLTINVSRCMSRSPWATSSSSSSTPEEGAGDEACAAVSFSGPLRDETQYSLVLPAGSRYSLKAGLTGKAQAVQLLGLRAFRIPIRQDFQMPASPKDNIYDGTKYKRLLLWLPHGLAPGTTPQRVAQQVTVCHVEQNGCEPVPISSSKLAWPSHVQLQLDGLQPRTHYRVSVAASDDVRDAFGKPLQASTGDFWSLGLSPYFAPPAGATPVAHFRPDAWPSEWPIAALGADGAEVKAGVWPLDASTEQGRAKIVRAALAAGDSLVEDLLGAPAAEVQRGNSPNPAQLSLPLDAAADAQLVAACCQQVYYPSARNVSSRVQLLLKTDLLATWLVAGGQQVLVWVTSSDPASPGPVKGAQAFLYWNSYDNTNKVQLVGSCTTDERGACSVAMPAPNSSTSLNLMGLVRGPGGKGGVVYTPNVGFWSLNAPTTYTGALALDRMLLRPGDTLHVAGYVAQKKSANAATSSGVDPEAWPLGAPNVTKAVVMVTPSWHGNGSYSIVTVPVTPGYGTVRATLPVPAAAAPGPYSVYLYISPDDQLPQFNGSVAPDADGSGRRRLRHATHSSAWSTSSSSAAAVFSSSSGASSAAFAGARATSAVAREALVAAREAVAVETAAAAQPEHHGEVASSGRSRLLHGASWRRELMQAPSASSGGTSSSTTTSWDLSTLQLLAYETVTVSDPRPPTADLNIKAAPWAKPNAAVSVSLTATSYLGSQVSGASINVVWSTALAQGLVVATTDAQGAATAVIPLDELPPANITSPGSSLSLTAEWVGPTRERVVRSASVALDDTDRRLAVSQTLATNVPGLTWGVVTSLTSNVDGSSVKGAKVKVTLAPNKTAGAECDTLVACDTLSGDVASGAQCQLYLPCVGTFILTACADASDPAGAPACANLTLGLNRTQWATAPYSRFDEPQLLPDRAGGAYKLGETAALWFQNAWGAEVTALVLWGNQDTTPLKQKPLGPLPVGPVKVEIPLGNECRGGCGVAVLLSVPAGSGVLDPLPGMVISKLFDPLGAHTHSLLATLTISEPDGLGVSISFADSTATTVVNGATLPVLPPGANTTVTISVSDKGAPVADAEVTLLAVDKSILDLLPYALKQLPPALALQLVPYLSAAEVDGTLVAPGALQLVFDAIRRRQALDPWLPADTTFIPAAGAQPWWLPLPWLSAVDLDDEQYLDLFTSLLTYGPDKQREFCGVMGACNPYGAAEGQPNFDSLGSATPPAGAAPIKGVDGQGKGASSGGGSSQSGASPRLTSKFLSTPLFTVFRTSTGGSGAATFTAPPNLGTFVFRAFVVTKGVSRLGSNETSLVVRQPLSLTASLPRIVRVGDKFMTGVLVTSPGLAADAAPFTVTVRVKVLGGLVELAASASANTKATLSGASNQAEVRFNFTAAALGDASLQFSVSDASGASDALVAPLPVLPQQSPVFVATSFSLRASANGSSVSNESSTGWQEGLALPEAAPGSGSLDLLAGVGYLPAILASTNAIATQRATARVQQSELDAYTSLALASVAPLMSQYGQPLSEAQLGNATDAFLALNTSLTHPQLGLLPYQPGASTWAPTRADIVLNMQGSWLISNLAYKEGPLKAAWGALFTNKVPLWKGAGVAQLVTDAVNSRNPPSGSPPRPYQDWYTLAWTRLAVGVDWYVPTCGTTEADLAKGVCTYDENVKTDLSLAKLIAAAPTAGLDTYLLTALALFKSENPAYAAFVLKAANAAVSSIRVQGRTAYVAAYPGARAAASLDTQAFALRLLSALKRPADAALVQKLAAYLAASGSTGSGDLAGLLPPPTQSAWVTAVVASTLAQYDMLAGSTTPDLSLVASVDSAVVLQATFDQSTVGAPPARSSTPWGDLASPPGPLTFNATGKGEVSVSVGLSFVPLKPLPFPTYRGIWVTSAIQLNDPVTGAPTGPPLAQAPLGSVLTVTVQVTSPDDLGAVTVEALTAGGLEPLDPALTSGQGTAAASSSGSCPLASWAGDAYGSAYWWWWWPICPTQAVSPRSVTWRFQRLMAGTQVLTYSAVAATEGAFMLPPIKASADDQPEVMGTTASGLFTVCSAGCSPATVSGSEGGTPAAKACPKDCSGNGACNTNSGQCVCASGWAGDACDRPAPA